MSFRSVSVVCAAVAIMTLSTIATAQDKGEANKAAADKNPMGYFLGISIGQSMVQQGFHSADFDTESLAAGVVDALAGRDPALSEEQLLEVRGEIESLLETRHQKMVAKQQQEAALNKEKGELWLKQNSKKDGIKSLAGGIQYKVINSGKKDAASPSASDMVKVHYTGKLITGKVFDSSVERGEPMELSLQKVITGWQLALPKMKVGDKWMLFIPPEHAYGPTGRPGAIGPNEVLVFEIELLEII